jgi:hypothetical protein
MSSARQIQLSLKGLENPASLGIKDFAIRVGSESIECSRFEASYLSPRITAALSADSTLDEYEVELDDCDGPVSAWMEQFLSLSRNGSFEVTPSNFPFVKCLAKRLGNRELCELLFGLESESADLNSSTICDRLSLAADLDLFPSREIDYLASHFFETDIDLLKSLSRERLGQILRSEKLQIESEDSLLDFVLGLGLDWLSFLGLVRSEYLSVSGIDHLLNAISLAEVDSEIWSSLCRRLRLPLQFHPHPESRFALRQFRFDPSRPFGGVISHFTKQCGGNVHTQGVISITASRNERNQCHQVADHDWTDYWFSNSSANSWIQFDFRDRRISPTHYTLRSDGIGCCHLLQWSLDGSDDEKSWTNLDRQNTQDLNGDFRVKSYSLTPSSSAFRYLRLTQTGSTSSNSHHLGLSRVEFFGKVRE